MEFKDLESDIQSLKQLHRLLQTTENGSQSGSVEYNKGLWMAKETGSLTEGGMAYDTSSRIEPKHSHQWFMDSSEAELFPTKKQAVEVPSDNSFSGLLTSSVSPWGRTSGFQFGTGQFTERLFNADTARPFNFDARNITSDGKGNIDMGRKAIEDAFRSDSSFDLSISHAFDDSRLGLDYGGIRKVKVSQVKDSENCRSVSLGHVYNRVDGNTISTPHAYGKADRNCISMDLSHNRGNDSFISMVDGYNREDNNFISMGQPYNKVDDSTISIGHPYKENNNAMLMGHSLSKGDNNITIIGQPFSREDNNNLAIGNTLENNDSILSMGQSFSNGDESNPAISQTFNKGECNAASVGNSYNKMDDTAILVGHTYSIVENHSLSTSHSFSKGKSNIVSFGRLICNYDLLGGQSSNQTPEALSKKGFVESNVDANISASKITSSASETVSKEEDQKGYKKVPPNNFPSNVRSLLSTGMFDGVPVKYIARSREKELRGVIKGSGYLCGCQSCNFSKAINAYEFERHAGCITKHPNNHMYFDNGKTIYGVVQELKNTPQNMLFEVIQTITGSPINQKSFRSWKESFLAATRELQRIYGKDEGKQFS